MPNASPGFWTISTMTNTAKQTNPDFSQAAETLFAARDLLLISHEFTDGDDLGAMLAMKFALARVEKQVTAVAHGGIQENLRFLPGVYEVLSELPKNAFDVVIFFGCGDRSRVGFASEEIGAKVSINIDHHPDNKLFANINLVESNAAATSEIVYDLLKFLKLEIDKPIATALLTGLFNDTGGFRHANTTPAVLEIAAELVRKGARIDKISEYYFGKNDLAKLRAWAKALENARFDPGQQMVYSVVTEEEMQEIGAQPEDLEGVVSVLNMIPEARFSMVLKQRGEEIKGSLRSENYKGVDVAAIARSFGGGGHKLAAGFKFRGRIERTPQGWRIT
ncbi:MAG: bifunctional oligoribonuclease/PAP phosphatase NrnA [Candidatus Doudnabacteria bacterium]|nr:bifunctional oligoribonuclease/PAP phosphatase NrnA [Candidatus Doudnabacteria bacterium]